MRQVPSSAVTVSWAEGVATITVHGELGADTSSQVRERIAAVAANRPQRVVLVLMDASNRSGAESLALIAVARHLLLPGCVLDVRSASPAVRQILRLAGWSGLGSGTGDDESEPGHEGW